MSRDARRGDVRADATDLRGSRPTRVARLAVMVCVALAVLAACGSGGAKKPAPPPLTGAQAADRQLVQGRNLYAKYCAECHGLRGEGGTGPEVAGGKTTSAFKTATQQADLVEHGRNSMPGFQGILSRAQIEAIVRYEREAL